MRPIEGHHHPEDAETLDHFLYGLGVKRIRQLEHWALRTFDSGDLSHRPSRPRGEYGFSDQDLHGGVESLPILG
jgi:hypothetical protein